MKLYRNLPIKIPAVLIFLALSAAPLAAQQEDPQFRLAQALENNQQYEQALELYLNLNGKYPDRIEIIKGIKRCSLYLQKYDELIVFYENLLSRVPAHAVWAIDLAEVYYLAGQRQKASAMWWAEIRKDPKNIAIYRLVAAAMINQRLFADAIEVYTSALGQIAGEFNLYIEIGNLYKQQLQYGQAAEQFLNYYSHNPRQKSFLQRQIMTLSDEAGQIPAVIQSLQKYLAAHPEQKEVQDILAGLYLKEKNYDQALALYMQMETSQNTGQYLLHFSAETFAAQAYEYTIKAHHILQEQYPDSPYRLQSYYDLGRSHYALARLYQEKSRMKEAESEMARAVDIFDSLASDPSRSILYAQSLVALGDLYYDFYFDLDRALTYYQTFIQTQPRNAFTDQIMIKTGDVYVCKNQLAEALLRYQQVTTAENKPVARFKTAGLAYYQGKISAARALLAELIPHLPTHSTLLNDALSQNMFLQTYAPDSSALVVYARCELFIFQHKLSQAAENLSALAAGKTMISAVAARKAAHLWMELNHPSTANELLLNLVNTYSKDVNKDETIFLLAQTEEKLLNFQQAITWYQQVLTGFPDSFFCQQARERIRKIQEQIKKEQS
jgi:tetratricopeptide (TPR) repeat protein